jgi:hypothetical protein
VRRSACLPLLLLGISACSGGSSGPSAPSVSATSVASQASIWFHPLPRIQAYPGGPSGTPGSADFADLFASGAAWPKALGRTSVIGLYAGWIGSANVQAVNQASDAELRSIVAFLTAHHMSIELEAPALQALSTCGAGVEGYVPYGQTVRDVTLGYLQRLKAAGAPVQFVKADEPYFFGSVSNEAQVCNFTVTQVAQQFQSFAQLVKSVYPTAEVGDVEPLITELYAPDAVTALGQWHDAYRALSGAPLPFFIADMDFGNPEWPSLAKSMENATRTRGMKFGIIYSGDPGDVSDAQWTGKAVARFQAYQGANGGRPDYALFQSWNQHPWRCLPETDPTTFTGVLDAYIAEY